MIIEDECFENVNEVMVNGLNELKYIQIGINSFTHLKSNSRWSNTLARNESRSFSILNCGELESIEIGRYSFSDYGGGFELKNLPKLSTIKIGKIRNDSSNFYYSSFEIKGIIDMILIWIDLPYLNSITLGKYTFQSSLSTVISSIWMIWIENRSSSFEFHQTW